MYKKHLILIAAVVVLGLVIGLGDTVMSESPSVATVDMQEVFAVHPAVHDVQERLLAEHEQAMDSLEESMEDMDEEEQMQAQHEQQQVLQRLQEELVEEAMETVDADVEEIARAMGYDLVFDVNAIVVGGENITEEVVSELSSE